MADIHSSLNNVKRHLLLLTEMPLSLDDCKLLKKAISLLGNKENIGGDEIAKVLVKYRTDLPQS